MKIESKQRISIGTASIDESICIPYVKGTACAACDEVCPTGATHMIKYKDDLPAPKMIIEKCIGCGACEHACPVSPRKAITVSPRKTHVEIAELPSKKHEAAKESDNNFAF